MWPFRRKIDTPPAASGPQPVPAPVIRRDWTGLAPIQRTVGQHPLTAPSDQFRGDLATQQDPSVSSDKMGHQVSAEAPAGIVLSLARPATRSDGPAMIPRPRVQRKAEAAAGQSGEWDRDEAAPPETRPSPLPASMRVAAVERPVVAPIAELPPLTALAADPQPVPVVSRIARPAPSSFIETAVSGKDPMPSPAASQPAPRLTLGQARRLGLGAPINRVADRTVQRSTKEPPEMPLSPSTAPPAKTDAAVPPSLEPTPPTTSRAVSLQREVSANLPPVAAARPAPLESPAETPRLELPLAPNSLGTKPSSEPAPSRPEPASSASADPVLAGATPPAPSMPIIQREVEHRAVDMRSAAQPTRSTDDAATPITVSRAMPLPLKPQAGGRLAATESALGAAPASVPAPPAASLAPLVGARPIATLQRSPEGGPAQPDHSGSRPLIAPLAGAPNGESQSLAALDERSETGLQSDDGDMTSLLPTSLQRASVGLAPSLVDPPRASEVLTLAPRRIDAGQSPSATATMSPTERESAGQYPLAPLAVVVQRIAAETPPEPSPSPTAPDEPALQREWFDSISSQVSSGGTPSFSQVSSAASAVGSGISSLFHSNAKPHESDMDELASKLYDRIRTRLKTELLVDRERAGFLTDLR